MTAIEVLLACARRGISLRADGDRLVALVPSGELPGDVATLLATHKPQLIELLATEAQAWDPAKAYALVRLAQAEVDAAFGERGYVRTEFLEFNEAICASYRSRSLSSVRAACAAWHQAVEARLGSTLSTSSFRASGGRT